MSKLYVTYADQMRDLMLREDIKTIFVYGQDDSFKEFAEIIRCKNCDWYDPEDFLCLREGICMDNDDFCSMGRPKNE